MAKFLTLDIMQEPQDLNIWELFFNAYNPRTMIELGTGAGGSALFFALQAYVRGMKFYTFDSQSWFDYSHPLASVVNMRASFVQTDIFSPGGIAGVRQVITTSPRPVCLFCDNGDKPREWREFAPLLQPGDFVAVHDFGTEFKYTDIGDVKVKRIMEVECDRRDQDRWLAMWFQRTE